MNVLIYTSVAFATSETFILKQVKNLTNNYFVIAESIQNKSIIPSSVHLIEVSPIPINLFDRVLSFLKRRIRSIKYSLPSSQETRIKEHIKSHRIDVIHINYGINAVMLAPLVTKLGIPFIVHFHGYDASQLLSDNLYLKALKKVIATAAKVIVVSKDMQKRLESAGLSSDRIEVIPYGVDDQLFLKHTFKTSNMVTVLHAGRLTPKKGTYDLVRIFVELLDEIEIPNIELIVIGEGEEKKISKFLEESVHNKSVKLVGSKSHVQVLDYMRHADIFVLNSRVAPNGDMEGFPNVIIEAMASKCAVLSTFHAGIPEAITNNYDGLLVKEHDNEQLKNALGLLISDKKLRIKLSENAMDTVTNKFTQSIMLEKYYQLYRSVTKK